MAPKPGRGPDQSRDIEQALNLHRQGQIDAAAALYAKIIARAPGNADALYFLGVLEFQRGRPSQAVEFIGKAVRVNPANPVAFFYLGCAQQELKRNADAVASYDRVLALKPDFAEALNNRGNAQRDLGRTKDALASFDGALALKPDFLLALYNRGNVLRDLKQPEAALASYAAALALKPDFVEILLNQGGVLRDLARYRDAMASYDRALAVRPDLATALLNRGVVLGDVGRHEEALASIDRALATQPDYIDALRWRGNTLRKLGRYDDALASYDRALAIRPNDADVITSRGNAFNELGRYDAALADYDRALSVAGDQVEGHNNRGTVLRNVGRLPEALDSYRRALALDPANAETHFSLGWTQLLLGDFAQGWEEYEWRFRCRQMTAQRRNFAQPQWRGEATIAGKTILLHGEQAYGDTIEFSRYALLVAQKGARVILEVPPALLALLRPLAGVDTIVAQGDPLPAFDYHCPLLSLPRAFSTRLDTIPAPPAYIAADPEGVARWRERLGARTGFRVGLVWASGNALNYDLAKRSMPLAALDRLRSDRVQFVSLQKELADTDKAVLSRRTDILHFGDQLGDFADTAALIAQMDLVISIDTGVGHLAGAMGKPVWLMLAFAPDWRWLLDRDDTPWYPSARLFRQKSLRDWDDVMARVVAAFEAWSPTPLPSATVP